MTPSPTLVDPSQGELRLGRFRNRPPRLGGTILWEKLQPRARLRGTSTRHQAGPVPPCDDTRTDSGTGQLALYAACARQTQGYVPQPGQAERSLAKSYSWFTEGFAPPDSMRLEPCSKRSGNFTSPVVAASSFHCFITPSSPCLSRRSSIIERFSRLHRQVRLPEQVEYRHGHGLDGQHEPCVTLR